MEGGRERRLGVWEGEGEGDRCSFLSPQQVREGGTDEILKAFLEVNEL